MKKRKSGGPSVPSKKSKLSTAMDVNRKLDVCILCCVANL